MTHQYIGTKVITAWPQTALSNDSINSVPGYAVKYKDGYTSWSPKDVFDQAYRRAEGEGQALTFGDALHFLKLGKRVARAGWNGRFMWLEIVFHDANHFIESSGGEMFPALDWIGMKTADDKFVPWLCSQTDALAEDWNVLP